MVIIGVPTTEEEYEIIPVSPLRRLEKRIEKIESFSGEAPRDIFRDVVDIVRMNQQIVDELVRSNDSLKIELAKLPAKIDELNQNLKELLTYIKLSGEEENVGIAQDAIKPVVEKLDELIKANKASSEKSDTLIEVLDEISKRLKRPVAPMPSRMPVPGSPLLHRPQPQQPSQLFKKKGMNI